MITHEALILITLFWLVCGYYSAGYHYGYFVREYPTLNVKKYISIRIFFWMALCAGPSSLVLCAPKKWRKHGRLYPWQDTQHEVHR